MTDATYYCQQTNGPKGPDITVSISGWSTWTEWGNCDVACGTGQRERTRTCSMSCVGDAVQRELCTVDTKIDGAWSSWVTSELCTRSCGDGLQKRIRSCNNPQQSKCGADCPGENNDYISCSPSACPVDGGWSSWISGGACPVTCGTGLQNRTRLCTSPAPPNNGASCQGEQYDYISCTRSACPFKPHIYGETHVNHTYQTDLQSAEIDVTATENLLNDSTDDPKPLNSQYEIVDTGLRQEVPQKNLAEQFWTIVDDHCIETIILLVKENEKVTEFYPMIDDVFRMNNFDVYLDSAERKNENIKLLTFNLENKTTQSTRQIKIFKTNVWEFPPVKGICFILDKASEMRGAPVLIINSKMADLLVCGVLTVCLNVIYAIKTGSSFSVLENAKIVNKNDRSFFKNFHSSEANGGIERGDLILGNRPSSRQVSSLPDTYANIRPAYLKTKPTPPNTPNTILKLPDHDYLEESLQFNFPAGKSAILVCNLNSQLQVRWQRQDNNQQWNMLPLDTWKYENAGTSFLTINNTTTADYGNYRCITISSSDVANNEYGTTTTFRVLGKHNLSFPIKYNNW
ncbi:HMCN [Mytilus coruscus]|uniref:HMCN n=1 Tax=Mytilus coruscus TaxID=42192 RepID=A0A6J8BKM9_MYTCO|nr:HMCN [Mytilus coruscus]